MKKLIPMFLLLLTFSCVANAISPIKIETIISDSAPNYSQMKGSKKIETLIDGKTSRGKTFWLDPATIGWQNRERITIDLVLQKAEDIAAINFATAKNESAGVYMPYTINLLASNDGKGFDYIGELKAIGLKPTSGYVQYKVELGSINVRAKYLRIVVHTQGGMFFVDEIFLERGGKRSNNVKAKSEKEIEKIIDDKRTASLNRRMLVALVESNTDLKANQRTSLIRTIEEGKELHRSDEVEKLKNRINQNIANSLNTGVSMLFYDFPLNSRNQKSDVKTDVWTYPGSRRFVIFAVENFTSSNFSETLSIKGNINTQTEIFEVKEVFTRKGARVPDPLVPYNINQKITLKPGEKKTFALFLDATKETKEIVNISIPGIKNSLEINFTSVDVGIDKSFVEKLNFNVNVWPYFSEPFYKGREKSVQEDLKAHYVNVFVIPAKVLLPNNVSTDHAALKNYMKNYSKGSRVLLFVNHRGYVANPGNYMSDLWKTRFTTWYSNIMKILTGYGVESSDVYLYPFDEIQPNEVDIFTTFSKWVKSDIPNAKIFSTVFENRYALVKDHADVIQVLTPKNRNFDFDKKSNREYWMYGIMDNSKDQNPVDYRLLAWRSFSYQATGTGFWNYADQYGPSIWDDNDGDRGDYNVVYDNGAGQIASSIRWEAFKNGVEDYFLLSMFQNKYSSKEAIEVAGVMLNSSNNSELNKQVEILLKKIKAKK